MFRKKEQHRSSTTSGITSSIFRYGLLTPVWTGYTTRPTLGNTTTENGKGGCSWLCHPSLTAILNRMKQKPTPEQWKPTPLLGCFGLSSFALAGSWASSATHLNTHFQGHRLLDGCR
eukprot:5433832-Amphidinium_carterae.1